LMKKMPFDYDWFCPLKMMAFMIVKGNIICWHFLKAFTFCRYFPLYSEGNNSIFLRQSCFPYNLRAFHTTVYHMTTSSPKTTSFWGLRFWLAQIWFCFEFAFRQNTKEPISSQSKNVIFKEVVLGPKVVTWYTIRVIKIVLVQGNMIKI
jgi:hypothetical protein